MTIPDRSLADRFNLDGRPLRSLFVEPAAPAQDKLDRFAVVGFYGHQSRMLCEHFDPAMLKAVALAIGRATGVPVLFHADLPEC